MKIFSCSSCQQRVFFDNVSCTRCGQTLAYLPDQGLVTGIVAVDGRANLAPASASQDQLWQALGADGPAYRLCRNWKDHGVCNWTVPAEDPHELCRACRLNGVIPRISDPQQWAAWSRLEAAKRRLVYSLLALGLPVEPKSDDEAPGLSFSFLRDSTREKVCTGHVHGVITLDVAEADAPFREKMRVQLGETYRTLLGHFRHEIGHYYWERLVSPTPRLPEFREIFGDERSEYAEAIARHYDAGAPSDWQTRFVSAYASMHPWEDWAETFAHYLHMVDTLETARAHGLSVRSEAAASGARHGRTVAPGRLDFHDFDDLVGGFVPVTVALNDLNRSMGLPDTYPFVLSQAAVEKLRFVHGVVEAAGRRAPRDDHRVAPSARGDAPAAVTFAPPS